MYKFGMLVLVPFPFTDLSSTKLRPALIIGRADTKRDDITVAFITSKISPKIQKGHFLLAVSDRDFSQTGLKTNSLVRFDKIATLNKKLIVGELGLVSPRLLKQMKNAFRASFGF